MDYTRFGLRRRPFRPTPDTELYYPATTHEGALDQLRRGIADDEGLLLLTAEPGLGKTLLARRLLETLEEPVQSVLLTNGHLATNSDLLQAVLFDLGLPYQGLSEQASRLAITDSLLERFQSGGKTLIVVDEANLLSVNVLEELRLLSNLEGSEGRAVQVLLVALPDIERTIASPALAVFRQRLTTIARLAALDIEESADYLVHQVRMAGGQPERVFGADVLDIIAHAAGGIPRILNRAAHLSFTLAEEAGNNAIDAEAAVEAVTSLGLDPISDAAPVHVEPEPMRIMPMTAPSVQPEPTPLMTRVESPRSTIPFPPVILPLDDGPPTYVYGDDNMPNPMPTAKGPAVWPGPNDRVG